MTRATWGDVYKELGAKPVINAIGSVTMLGGSTPPREIKEAMDRADSAYVPLMELEEKAGEAVARMVNVPAAYITSGAGSALTLAAAAAMAGDDDKKIEQLPDATGMRNEVLIQKRHRYWYDRCLEASGAKLVEFGADEKTTRQDLERAIGPGTAAVHFVANELNPDPNALSLEDTVQIARAHGLPVLVDAAGMVYPLELMGKYVRMGADFQCIAAKYLGSPHSSGFALGSKEFIRKLSLQSFAAYEGRRVRGIGRPHKVDRQEMIGVVAAVKRWMTMNHEDRLADAERKTQTIIAHLRGIPGVHVQMINNVTGVHPFGLTLSVDKGVTRLTVEDIVRRLMEGDPPIWTRVRPENAITIHVFGLYPGQDRIVGERIAALVKGKR